MAEGAGDKEALALGSGWRFGDLAAAERDLAVFTALAEERQQPLLLWRATMWRAMRALLDGRFADADRLITEAKHLGQHTQNRDVPLTVAVQSHILRRQRGWLTEADLVAEIEARKRNPSLPAQDPWLVRLAVDMGRRVEAQAGLDRLAAQDAVAVPRGSSRLPGLAMLAEACARLGDCRHAATLYTLLEPFAARPVMSGGGAACHGAVAYYLALLATTLERWPRAEEHFHAAVVLHERLGARVYLAQTWLDHGRMLLIRGLPGDAARAAALLAQAGGLAEELGMAPLTSEVARLLEEHPAPSEVVHGVPAAPAYPDGLTAREVEVLHLLAAGLTNKEIAAALVVSDRTVGNHISNLYSKIGARRRDSRHRLCSPPRPRRAGTAATSPDYSPRMVR